MDTVKPKQVSAAPMPQVVVVGSINMDMVARSTRLPAPGETLMGEAFAMEPGGKGANQAVAAARLGARTAFIGRIGTRLHGDDLLAALAEQGVDSCGVVTDCQACPGIALIMVASSDGENSIVYVPGSNAQLSEADVQANAALLRSARVVVAQLEVPLAAVQAAFMLAHGAGVTTLLNAAPAQPLPNALLEQTDCLIVNETELGQLSGAPSDSLAQIEAAAQALRARGARRVLVTLGPKGVLCCEASGVKHLSAKVVNAVDTVGAGDTFVGGVAAGLAEGMSMEEAIRLGQAAAAIAVSRAGVQSAMPRRSEIGSVM